MLQQKPTIRRIKLDKTLVSELEQLGTMQMELAKKQKVTNSLQKLAAKTINYSKEPIIDVAVVFLTEKTQSPAIKKVLDWIGVKKQLDNEMVFSGKVNGVLRFNENNAFRMHLIHFDHYPVVQKLSENKKILNIIVYDTSYKASYANWDLAFDLLGSNPSVQLMVDITDGTHSSIPVPPIEGVYTQHLKVDQLGSSAQEILLDENLIVWIQIARMKSHLSYLAQVYQLTSKEYDHKEQKLQGKSILSYKKYLESQNDIADLSTKDIGFLKAKIDDELKQINRLIEEGIESFDKGGYKELEDEITSFLGFVEKKGSKYISLKVSEGAILDKTAKANVLLKGFFDQTAGEVNIKLKSLEDKIAAQFTKWQLNISKLPYPTISDVPVKEILDNNETLPDKPYEKQIPYKGMGGLLMELRTPLFMLMPFMMIFALFGALVGGEDKGNIDESILFYENRPCLAIDLLPEARGSQYRKFINDVEDNRDPRKGVFDKEISSELVTEPQLAVKTIQVAQSFGDKVKNEETLDYHFDSKNQIIYLYLTENADRNFVIEKLYDPNYKLLSIPSATRRGFGIGGLIRALSGLREYRYIILIGLVSLISWFVITRSRSMKAETKSLKRKEQNKLNSDLRQHIDRIIKQSLQKWRSKVIDELSAGQNAMHKTVEWTLNKNIEDKRLEKLQRKKVIQKRLATIKTDRSKLLSLHSEHRKIKTKMDQIEAKVNRMIRP